MESLLDCGRSLLFAGSNSKAACSTFDQIEMECAAALDDDDDTASLSSSGGNCFNAFLDTIQVFSLQNSATNEDDATMVPWREPTLKGFARAEERDGGLATVVTPLRIAPSHPFSQNVQDNEESELVTLPPALARHGSNIFDSEAWPEYSKIEPLPEYSRQHHNDRGQRDRRQSRKRKGVEVEWLQELQDRRHHNDRGQSDRRRRFLLGRNEVKDSNVEVSIVNKLAAETSCVEALRAEVLDNDVVATKAARANDLSHARS